MTKLLKMETDKSAHRQKNRVLPCEAGGECPYEYGPGVERDIEGMPFIEGDWRSCPVYGHICPQFMEELGLTVEDLEIRAVIHCGFLRQRSVEERREELTPEIELQLKRFKEYVKKYPPDKYPQYY